MAAAVPESDPTPSQRDPGSRSLVWNGIAFALVAAGLVLSVSMLWRGYALISEKGASSADVCSAVFGTGCDATLLDPSSRQLGLPLAGWGVVYYATLAALLLLAWGVGESFTREAIVGALALAVVGMCVSIVLAGMMFADVVPLCPMCLVVHGLNVALVPVLKRVSGRPARDLLLALAHGGRYLIGGKTDDLQAGRWKFVGFFTTALVAVVCYQWVLIEFERRTKSDPQQILAAYAASPIQEIAVGEDDPRLGPSDAPVEIVVFSSFGCPACQRFSRVLRQLSEEYGDALTIVFKHYPLEKSCNAGLKSDRFPHACEAAFVAEAARRLSRFWQFHDLLFQSSGPLTEKSLDRAARQCGLDSVRLQSEQDAGGVRSKVSRDIEQGNRLKVDATPTVFLNRKRVGAINFDSLKIIIRQQLAVSRR